MSVAAIIAAAGSSSRLGHPKQLVPVDGEPMLERAVRLAQQAGANPVFVVLGAHRDAIQESLDFGTAQIVVNDRWQEGLSSSIRAGIQAVETGAPRTAGALLMVCDQPGVTQEHLHRMIATFEEQSIPSAIASAYVGTRGIPAIFPRDAFLDLLALRGDKGARGLLVQPTRRVVEVPLEGGQIDIDLPEDLAKLS